LLSKDLLKGTSLAPHRMIAPRYSCYSIWWSKGTFVDIWHAECIFLNAL
jgi:hypothetical protein